MVSFSETPIAKWFSRPGRYCRPGLENVTRPEGQHHVIRFGVRLRWPRSPWPDARTTRPPSSPCPSCAPADRPPTGRPPGPAPRPATGPGFFSSSIKHQARHRQGGQQRGQGTGEVLFVDRIGKQAGRPCGPRRRRPTMISSGRSVLPGLRRAQSIPNPTSTSWNTMNGFRNRAFPSAWTASNAWSVQRVLPHRAMAEPELMIPEVVEDEAIGIPHQKQRPRAPGPPAIRPK